MDVQISVIIPNRNGERTIARCLRSVFASRHDSFEVIVVDDASQDRSVEIIRTFPCKLISLPHHHGASRARNEGARHASGKILFFTDADCVIREETLVRVSDSFQREEGKCIIGGTYTPLPHDSGFFSTFQSVFIHYSETKNADNPDYIATHAMAIDAEAFRRSGGFPESFLPLIEDVEFSHRMKRQGHALRIDPSIQVRHIFNFNLYRSLMNGYRKSKYWTLYSVTNKDILSDSGTASIELKANVFIYFTMTALFTLWLNTGRTGFPLFMPLLFITNVLISRGFLRALYKAKGMVFALSSSMYYFLLYPVPVGLGAAVGLIKAIGRRKG